jgi:hypothetical protein
MRQDDGVRDSSFEDLLRDLGELTSGATRSELDCLREVYDTYGSFDTDAARLALGVCGLEALERALPVVINDVERTTNLEPDVQVFTETFGTSDRIGVSYNGSYRIGFTWPIAQAGLLVALVDYLRDFVVEDLWCAWPLCPHHGYALYPEIHRSDPVWACRSHDHTVARIGELQLP